MGSALLRLSCRFLPEITQLSICQMSDLGSVELGPPCLTHTHLPLTRWLGTPPPHTHTIPVLCSGSNKFQILQRIFQLISLRGSPSSPHPPPPGDGGNYYSTPHPHLHDRPMFLKWSHRGKCLEGLAPANGRSLGLYYQCVSLTQLGYDFACCGEARNEAKERQLRTAP